MLFLISPTKSPPTLYRNVPLQRVAGLAIQKERQCQRDDGVSGEDLSCPGQTYGIKENSSTGAGSPDVY